METTRLEAFSDGVIAIIITIMVLEFKVPHGSSFQDLLPLWPIFFSYVLSFIYVAIYWNNHHHLFQLVEKVNGSAMWANAHLLFWLSMAPFVTAWSGENHFEAIPVMAYGFVLLMCSIAFFILTRVLINSHGKQSKLAHAIGADKKGKISTIIYIGAILIAYFFPIASLALYVVVALIWLVPDKRVEKELVK